MIKLSRTEKNSTVRGKNIDNNSIKYNSNTNKSNGLDENYKRNKKGK